MDKAAVFVKFAKRLAEDEAILRRAHAEIAYVLGIGGVPAGVLRNYEEVSADWERGVTFLWGLLTKYSDPKHNASTPSPMLLPHFTTARSPETFGATTILTTADVSMMPCPAPAGPTPPERARPELGAVPAAVIIGIIVIAGIFVAGYAAKEIIEAWNDTEVRVAIEYTEQQKQRNFQTIWSTATKALTNCIGPQPTPEKTVQCWQTVMGQVPAIVQAIPKHQPAPAPPGSSFTGFVVGAVVLVGLAVGGYFIYRHVKESRAEKDRPPRLPPSPRMPELEARRDTRRTRTLRARAAA